MDELAEKMLELDELLLQRLNKYGFKKKRKHVFNRLIGECLQNITIVETKTRGKSEVHICICVGFSYEKVNRLISFIQNKKYDKKWATAGNNLGALIRPKIPYGFYIRETTDLSPIVDDIMHNIEKYAFDFFESCSSLEKYEKMLIDKDENVRSSTSGLKRAEWNLLALALLLNHYDYEEIFEKYKDDFNRNVSLLQVAKERISDYDVVKESELI